MKIMKSFEPNSVYRRTLVIGKSRGVGVFDECRVKWDPTPTTGSITNPSPTIVLLARSRAYRFLANPLKRLARPEDSNP